MTSSTDSVEAVQQI